MKQTNTIKITSEDGKITLYCDQDTSLGSLHDFLMYIKGVTVERINAAQKEEQEAADKIKETDEKKEKDKEE